MTQSAAAPVRLLVRNVRSFAGLQAIPLAPLTVLVGENSSGKSTCLGMLSAVLSMGYPLRPKFNELPFDFGSFSSIATRRRDHAEQVREFGIGVSEGTKGDPNYTEMIATFGVAKGDRTEFSKLSIGSPHGSLTLTRDDADLVAKACLTTNGADPIMLEGRNAFRKSVSDMTSLLIQLFVKTDDLSAELFHQVLSVGHAVQFLKRSHHGIAPIRTRPYRVYDGVAQDFSPTGEHAPRVLARLLRSADSTNQIKRAIVNFGHESNMFRGVRVKTLDNEPSSPFQLLARMPGLSATLADVGYGVSQVLPVLTECLTMPANAVLTLQQPEVHLHPRAQARLGTFFADLLGATDTKMIVIETHSDYLLNRIRMEVARKTISPESVCILFFDKPNASTKVYRLAVDEVGNVVNAPKSYRRFFVNEEVALLTRSES